MSNWSEGDIKSMIANPYNCLRQVAPLFAEEHAALVSEPEWVKAGIQLIEESGAEDYLRSLLSNLSGAYPTNEAEWNENNVKAMLTNPFYCLTRVAPALVEDHEPVMSETEWVKGATDYIRREGAEDYLLYLLASLRGDASDPDKGSAVPATGKTPAACFARESYKVPPRSKPMTEDELETKLFARIPVLKEMFTSHETEAVIFSQPAFGCHLTDDELWLIGAFVKVAGRYGKQVLVAPIK